MKKHLVWDLPVRLFHWLLVFCLFGQWLTAEILDDAMQLHFYLGYCTLGLIIFRLLWGFLGTKYARFSNFLGSPKAMVNYLRSLTTQSHQLSVGHNVVGGLLLPAVLLIVGSQAVSGLFTSDDIVSAGPYYDSASKATQEWMQWIHHTMFDLLMGLTIIHVLAIGWYRWRLQHDLIQPMLTGKKAIEPSQAIANSKLLRALLIATAVGLFVYWLVEINPPPVEAYYY